MGTSRGVDGWPIRGSSPSHHRRVGIGGMGSILGGMGSITIERLSTTATLDIIARCGRGRWRN